MTAKHLVERLARTYQSRSGRSPPGDQDRVELALEFLPIVKSEVLRFKMRVPDQVEEEELNGVAISGLMHALEKAEGSDPLTFGAYVRQRVRGAILDELRRMDVLTRGGRKKAKAYDAAVLAIEQREGRPADEEEIREELGLTLAEFRQLMEELQPITFLSIEGDSENQHQSPLRERMEDLNSPTVPSHAERHEVAAILQKRLEQLPLNQQQILHMYYFKDFRLGEIAEVFGVSESRICQLHTQAIRALKQCMRKAVES